MKTILILILIFLCVPAFATDYYMASDGNNGNTGLSAEQPWLTFAYAFSQMSAADTLILADGTYTSATNGGINTSASPSGQPPNGSDAAHRTVVKSTNGMGSVVIQSALILGTSDTKRSYIEINGLKFTGLSQLYNTSYNYVHDCLFYSNTYSAGYVLAVGTVDHANGNTYNVIEDCAIDGYERIGGINYNSQYNVWRRIVIRMNGSNYSAGNPSVGFTIYSSQFISAQNIIVLDRVQGDAYPGQDFAGVQADPAGDFGDNEWLGCMDFDADENGWMIEPSATATTSYTWRMINTVVVDATSYGVGVQGTGAQSNVLMDHNTVINPGLTGLRMIVSGGCTNPTAQNNYIEGSAAFPIYVDCTGTTSQYNQGYNNAEAFTPSGSNNNVQDGQFLYPTQPGAGALASNDESYRGAYVLKRYGSSDGLYYGQEGYNTLSATDLWPWPNEAAIKTDFAAISERGFCGTGKQLNGTDDVTFTSYIWEYLGNAIPEDIYGPAAPDTTDPVVTITTPTSNATYATSSSSITIGGTCTDNVACTSVTWTCATCTPASGTASGTANWTVANIVLAEGENAFIATGHDAAENDSDTDTLTVTYTAPVVAPGSGGRALKLK